MIYCARATKIVDLDGHVSTKVVAPKPDTVMAHVLVVRLDFGDPFAKLALGTMAYIRARSVGGTGFVLQPIRVRITKNLIHIFAASAIPMVILCGRGQPVAVLKIQ
tara:strand:- start:1294 stop:1611 length:318 start_codon:yes stop_codon:yes gene_type:complete